jgi:hypothetical protein
MDKKSTNPKKLNVYRNGRRTEINRKAYSKVNNSVKNHSM